MLIQHQKRMFSFHIFYIIEMKYLILPIGYLEICTTIGSLKELKEKQWKDRDTRKL